MRGLFSFEALAGQHHRVGSLLSFSWDPLHYYIWASYNDLNGGHPQMVVRRKGPLPPVSQKRHVSTEEWPHIIREVLKIPEVPIVADTIKIAYHQDQNVEG